MSSLKSGDLCLIVLDIDDYNLGKAVELVELIPHGGVYEAPGVGGIIENGSGAPVWLTAGDVRDIGHGFRLYGFVQKGEENLMKINGDEWRQRQDADRRLSTPADRVL